MEPAHSGELPLTVPAFAGVLTVNALNDETVPPHIELTVYVIFVVPAVNVVTNPAASTVATAVLLLLHVPPVLPSLV